MTGKLIRLFLTDGDADGIRTIEISNMTIKGTLFPRPTFDDFKKRPESKKPGVYMIYGEDYESSSTKLYIGEGDPVAPRLYSHYGNKDFWTNAIVFTSKDDYLTKTQIQYLESNLIKKAKKAGKVILDNGNYPAEPNISEVDLAEVTVFLDSILLLMKAMGIGFFIPEVSESIDQNVTEIYTMKHKNVEARMVISNGKYVLLKGSTVVAKETSAAAQALKLKRKNYLENGILSEIEGDKLIVNENLEFDSASYAACIVAGSSINGLISWKLNGTSLKEIEKQKEYIANEE